MYGPELTRIHETHQSELADILRGYDEALEVYAPALLRTTEQFLQPAEISESDALLGYAHKEEVSFGLDDTAIGAHAPERLTVAVLHREEESGVTVTPVWRETTPDHLRKGWQFSTQEMELMKQALTDPDLPEAERALLLEALSAQTESMSTVAVAAITGGAILPTRPDAYEMAA